MNMVGLTLTWDQHREAIKWLCDRDATFQRYTDPRRDPYGAFSDIVDVRFEIEQPRIAMLFKLTWAGV